MAAPTPLGRALLATAALLWAAALVLAPLAVAHPYPSWPAGSYALAFAVYGVGSFLCHQMPERSFVLWSVQMPVCARCAGIYVAAAGAALLSRYGAVLARFRSPSMPRHVLAAACLPSIATLVYEWSFGQTPANWIRALAGAPVGAVVAELILAPDARTSAADANHRCGRDVMPTESHRRVDDADTGAF
jgi:uncharacterized membrane protein